MYAIIHTGGKEYNVEVGSTVAIEKLDGKAGDEVTLDKVLLIADNENVKIGKPFLNGAKVLGEIVGQTKADKIIVFKRTAKKGYKRRIGHRQKLTEVKIKEIIS